MQAVPGRQKGGHGPRCSIHREWKLGMRMRLCALFVTDWGVLQRMFSSEYMKVHIFELQKMI